MLAFWNNVDAGLTYKNTGDFQVGKQNYWKAQDRKSLKINLTNCQRQQKKTAHCLILFEYSCLDLDNTLSGLEANMYSTRHFQINLFCARLVKISLLDSTSHNALVTFSWSWVLWTNQLAGTNLPSFLVKSVLLLLLRKRLMFTAIWQLFILISLNLFCLWNNLFDISFPLPAPAFLCFLSPPKPFLLGCVNWIETRHNICGEFSE